MGPLTARGRSGPAGRSGGYAILIFLFILAVMSLGLTVAVPVWETQMQREKEAELIFRGNQYVEGVRIYQLKNPGAFPKTLDEMVEKKCLRRLYRDPMSGDGQWNVILQQSGFGGASPLGGPGTERQGFPGAAGRAMGPGARGQQPGMSPGPAGGQKVLVAPVSALSSIQNPRIIGVVSSSTRKSIRIYNEQESYDKWLFFYGQDPKNLPEIIYYGETEKNP